MPENTWLENPRGSDFSTHLIVFLTHKLLFTALQRPLQRFSLSNVTHLVQSVCYCSVSLLVFSLPLFCTCFFLKMWPPMSVFYNCSFVFCHLMPSLLVDHRWINVRGSNRDVMKVHLGKSANVGQPTVREKQMHAAPLNLRVRCYTSGRDEGSEAHSLSMMSLRTNESAQWHS